MASIVFGCANAQTPGGINYQGVARNQFLVGLNNDSIQLRFTVKEKTANGSVLYTETRGTRTDSFGVFNVVIGSSGAISQSGNIKQVPWSDTTKKFLQVELNTDPVFNPQFLDMGTTQLLSVPFSFYSDISDSAKFSKGSGQYYFSASMPLTHSQTIPSGDSDEDYIYDIPLKFPKAIINEGNHYDTLTSEFTAPDSGLYAFEVYLMEDAMINLSKRGNHSVAYRVDLQFAILKNGNAIRHFGRFYEERDLNINYEDRDYSEGNYKGQIRLKLKKGDKVGVGVNRAIRDNTVKIGLGIDPNDEDYELIFEYYNSLYEGGIVIAEFSGHKIK